MKKNEKVKRSETMRYIYTVMERDLTTGETELKVVMSSKKACQDWLSNLACLERAWLDKENEQVVRDDHVYWFEAHSLVRTHRKQVLK